jgi:hypothetical protein
MLQSKEASTQSRKVWTASVRRLRVQRFARKSQIVFPGLLVTKKCFERIGPLDENIVFYQEWDASIRLAKYCRFGFVFAAFSRARRRIDNWHFDIAAFPTKRLNVWSAFPRNYATLILIGCLRLLDGLTFPLATLAQ